MILNPNSTILNQSAVRPPQSPILLTPILLTVPPLH
jgi:hypothetical protein